MILNDNKLGNEGVQVIAAGLRESKTLRRLDLSNCGFTMFGGDVLLTAVI